MYTMKVVCEQVGMTYETLKFYCKEGLVPNVQRDEHNYRIFDEQNIAWLKGLQCLRKCGMSIPDMKLYMEYCLVGPKSIPKRKAMLAKTKDTLENRMKEIQESIQFIDDKQAYYDGVVANEIVYTSNLIKHN